jgi:hypothetical protein
MEPRYPGVGTGNSATLRAKLRLVLPILANASERLFAHPRIHDLYAEYLVATHWIIRASVPLMQAARDRARALDGPVAAGLAEYLDEHIEEEREHDEWLLDDLGALGRDRRTILGQPPSATTASCVGAQYYWIFHFHPVALLGYIGLLEGYPPTPAMINGLMARTGYGPDAFRTLMAHAELDPHHRAEFDAALDALPLTPEQASVIGMSAMSSAHLMARALDEVAGGTARLAALSRS